MCGLSHTHQRLSYNLLSIIKLRIDSTLGKLTCYFYKNAFLKTEKVISEFTIKKYFTTQIINTSKKLCRIPITKTQQLNSNPDNTPNKRKGIMLVKIKLKLVIITSIFIFFAAGQANATSCRIMQKHSNFYEEIGKVENGTVKIKYSNFYEEVGRIRNGYIEVKHSNFYDDVGRVSRGAIEKKHSNFYEEFGRVYGDKIEQKHSNFYEELGKADGNCTDEEVGAGAVLLKLLPFDNLELPY